MDIDNGFGGVSAPSSASSMASTGLSALGGIVGGPIGALAGGIFGGVFNNNSAKKAAKKASDDANLASLLAWERSQAASATANAFEREQAQNQMNFQERMANSAHQREVADLRAAGLNPVLSGTGGLGSSTPSGASGRAHPATASQAATAPPRQVFDVVGPAIATALGAVRTIADIDKTRAETEDIKSQQHFRDTYSTAKTDAEIATMAIEQGLKSQQASLTTAQTEAVRANMSKIRPEINKLVAEAKEALSRSGNLNADTRSKEVNAAADEWSAEYGIPKIKRALEAAGLGSEVVKDLSQAIWGSVRNLIIKPVPSKR